MTVNLVPIDREVLSTCCRHGRYAMTLVASHHDTLGTNLVLLANSFHFPKYLWLRKLCKILEKVSPVLSVDVGIYLQFRLANTTSRQPRM